MPNSSSNLLTTLCFFATGRYVEFLRDIVTSAQIHFHPTPRVRLAVFTDTPDNFWARACELVAVIPHLPWPKGTLYRYRWLLEHERLFADSDYIFMCDADMRFIGPVRRDILAPLVAVQHQYYIGTPTSTWGLESRKASTAYVAPNEGPPVKVAGGFQGGRTETYFQAIKEMDDCIRIDEDNGIVAAWHDESHWNHYLTTHRDALFLSPAYCSNEVDRVPGAKLLSLEKDHAAFRKS